MRTKKNELLNMKITFFKKIIYFMMFFLIIYYLYITIYKGDYYKEKLNTIINTSYINKNAPRGRIYDRNYNLIVDNKLVPTISYLMPKKASSKEMVSVSEKLASLIDIDFSKLSLKNLKDYYMAFNDTDNLISNEEWRKYNRRKLNDNDIYNMKLDRIDNSLFDNYTKQDNKSAYIYTLMNNGYSYDIKIIKDKDLTDKEISLVCDNYEELPGIIIDYKYERDYLYGDTFKSILGSISTIPYEDKDYYLDKGYQLNDLVGVSFLEKQYERFLKGEKGRYKIENNSINVVKESVRGNDIVLTIDIKLQEKVDKILEEELINAKYDPNTHLFNSAYVVIKDPKNGDILAMSGKGIKKVNGKYVTYDLTPGVITNSMTPGSVVKGASIMVGYKEKAISIGEELTDNCVKLYNFPIKCSWKRLGVVNDIKAISLSSNIYQFKTALKVANINYSYNTKVNDVRVAFNKYRAFFKELGLGSTTEIDLPIDGIGNIGTSNSPDLYLNYVIGQYDSYTTMQLSEYISTIANYGERVYPHLLLEVNDNTNIIYKYKPSSYNISIDKKYIDRVRTSFKEVINSGLGRGFMVNNSSGKTGTSETFFDSNNDGVVDTPTVSSAFVGYFPSDNPKFSIALTFPNIMRINGSSEERSYANKRITRKISELLEELF